MTPADAEISVVEHRVSAFMGTDLDIVLRAHDVRTLILCGISTSGGGLAMLRYASDADYRCIVVEDCCADADPEVHACLMGKVFPRQATVTTSDALIDRLDGAAR